MPYKVNQLSASTKLKAIESLQTNSMTLDNVYKRGLDAVAV